jgi:restriction endonuclease Mrr
MAEFYTNLPPKQKDELDKTIEKLTTTNYETEYQFNVGEYDTTVGFFVKRGFSRTAAESTAYVILSQAKIDSIRPHELLDKLTQASPAQLSELITIILNANRYKSSRLGVRQTLTTVETVSRNIID